MPRPCGKGVQRTRIKLRKTIGQLSTVLPTPTLSYIRAGVQVPVSPKVIRTFPQSYSPLKIAFLPLVEHYFYPVSTGPTNTDTK